MGRTKRGRKLKKAASDDEDLEDHEMPDPESEDFFHDAVDKFNLNREKILLDTGGDDSDAEDSVEEEDIMGLDLPDSEDEEVEEEDDDDDESEDDDDENDDHDDDDDISDHEAKLPNDKSWGKKKAAYYSADTAEQDVDHLGSDDEAWEMEKEEETEALALQKSMAADLDEEDFDTANFEIPQGDEIEENDEEEDEETSKTVIMDLTKLSKEQKLEILFRDSPELFELLDEFKEKLQELVSKICPLMELSKTGKLPLEGSKYIELKHQLLLNYCINIGFYLLLKSKQTPVKDHPVIGRIVQYRALIKELEPLDSKLDNDIKYLLDNKETLLQNSENGEVTSGNKSKKVTKSKNNEKKKKFKKPKAKLSALLDDSDEDEQEMHEEEPPRKRTKKSKANTNDIDPLEYYEKVKMEKKKAKQMKDLAARLAHEPEMNLDDLDINEEGKRAITYQISKNKGLTAKKKKEDRNPRVKHRKKYSKAVIKRKSQVRPVVTEMSRYDGEKSGIRTFLTRSTKIK